MNYKILLYTISMLLSISVMAVVIINNKKLNKEHKDYYYYLKWLTKKDPLTNCYNRNYYNELQSISREQEYYVSVVDLNDLKTINDTQGHIQGDIAIKELAKFLKGFGEVIRMGGDEFLVVSKEQYAELNGRFENYCSATVKKAQGMDLDSAYDSADKLMLRFKGEK